MGARLKGSVPLTYCRDALGAEYVEGKLCGCGMGFSSEAVSSAGSLRRTQEVAQVACIPLIT